MKVYSDRQPHILSEVFGMYYQQFTFPEKVTLTGFEGGEPEAETFMELLIPDGAEIISAYQHPNWKSMPQLRIILMKAEMPGISDVCLKNATCSSC